MSLFFREYIRRKSSTSKAGNPPNQGLKVGDIVLGQEEDGRSYSSSQAEVSVSGSAGVDSHGDVQDPDSDSSVDLEYVILLRLSSLITIIYAFEACCIV